MPFYFGQLSVQGQEYLPINGPVVLAPTHRSRWDAIIVPYVTGRLVTGRDVYFMVSANEMRGIQGWAIQNMGGFPVNTDHPGRASIRCGVDVLRAQKMMVIFPEGGIFQDGQLHPLKLGPAHIAFQTMARYDLNVKVVPIALQYSQPVPTWHSSVTVRIGQPLETVNYANSGSRQRTSQLTIDLERALKELALST